MSHEHWSNYWQSGVQTSLPQDFKNNYDGEIYDFWKNVVKNLSDNSYVVDVCTGNGAVALLIAELAEQQNKQVKITAVDISRINTDHIKANNPPSQTKMIQFVSEQPIEDIDTLIKQPQDLIVSQFGIEYSDLYRTAPALAKIIKPQGSLVFIAHSIDGAVFDFMTKEESVYQWLETVGILSAFLQYSEGTLNAEELTHEIQNIINNHQPHSSFQGQPLFKSWLKLIGQIRQSTSVQINSQKQAISHFVSQHQSARKRQQDMIRVTKKLIDKNWYQPLLNVGFELIRCNELKYKIQHHIGTIFEFIYK